MRFFIAIPLPPEIRDALSSVQRRLQRVSGAVRWVEPEGMHLTLRFLGEMTRRDIAAVHAAMERAAAETPAMLFDVRGVGGFPVGKSPRVVWAGVEGETAPLSRCIARLEEEVSALGVVPERRKFVPHVTLGRARARANAELVREMEALAGAAIGSFEAEEMVLFESLLDRDGPSYLRTAASGFGDGEDDNG